MVLAQVEGFGARLRSLHLGSNLLTRVPEGLERLGHLRELILDGNYLTAIPPSLLQLRRLTLLVLSYNSLVHPSSRTHARNTHDTRARTSHKQMAG